MSESEALNRIADAIFAVAKAKRHSNEMQERIVEVSEAMCEMQKTNLAVSKALEQKLLLDGASDARPAN